MNVGKQNETHKGNIRKTMRKKHKENIRKISRKHIRKKHKEKTDGSGIQARWDNVLKLFEWIL